MNPQASPKASEQAQARPQLRPMRADDLDAVMAIEAAAYDFPWTRGNFIDSLAAGYLALVLAQGQRGEGALVAYLMAMRGVGEMHLLNVTVAPPWQRRGLAQQLLAALEQACRAEQLPLLWLEVRASNRRARDIYRLRGFAEVGLRRGYYPALGGQREDAVVMRLELGAHA
jgi:[ribosomal protein S18]-alanine N-acetyltransferase